MHFPIPLVVAVLSGILSPACAHNAEAPPPSRDPFYTAPSHFASARPGEVLRIRPAPNNVTGALGKNCSAAYNILYRTTDANYRPSWAVTTLLVPARPAPNPPPLLSYQIPYDSVNVDASPSYGLPELYSGPPAGGIPTASADIGPSLGLGWFVNVPDYEGPLASFGLGIQAGHATIDSVRAALSVHVGPGRDAPVALWGYSGGSLATEFAAELQAQYAPEMHLRGVAVGGLVPNLTDVYNNIDATDYAGDLPSLLLGIVTQDAAVERYLLSRLKEDGPYNRTGFLAARQLNAGTAFSYYAGQDISEYFLGGKSDIFGAPIMQKVLGSTPMGYHGVPQMPVFAYKAIHDEFSSIALSDDLIRRYCGVGAEITFERNTVGGHIAEITNGAPRALEWLASVLDESYKRMVGCTIKDVTIAIVSTPA